MLIILNITDIHLKERLTTSLCIRILNLPLRIRLNVGTPLKETEKCFKLIVLLNYY